MINKKEYENLKKAKEGGCEWVAKDENGWVFAHRTKPKKRSIFWLDNIMRVLMSSQGLAFEVLSWEDEEPRRTDELIKEYESEETEVKKDKKWLVDKLTKERNNTYVHDPAYQFISEFIADVNQLEEPETLSEYWIEQKSIDTHVDTLSGDVHVTFRLNDLQNLLVPKQELPAIPKFVDKWISVHQEVGFDLYPALKRLEKNQLSWEEIYEWYRKNTRKFVNAYLTGRYEVEEEREQKFYVMSNDNRMMLVRMMDDKTITEADPFPFDGLYDTEKKSYRLTEQEIKDFDPRYWPFRKPVEEVEENDEN